MIQRNWRRKQILKYGLYHHLVNPRAPDTESIRETNFRRSVRESKRDVLSGKEKPRGRISVGSYKFKPVTLARQT